MDKSRILRNHGGVNQENMCKDLLGPFLRPQGGSGGSQEGPWAPLGPLGPWPFSWDLLKFVVRERRGERTLAETK